MGSRTNQGLIWGAAFGSVHFAAICGLAVIVVRGQVSGASHEYWSYAGIFDLPIVLLLSPLLNLVAGISGWPDVSFLPGSIGSWDRFLFPFLFYGVFGTIGWFLIGWALMRISSSRYLP